ncbi:Hypothetical_protein [Hexamita inflata]|uniref:Hypothetical_protein n=1 Tax=Hexamita inflata TaxID=28002 RepID=A0ABP1GFW3_9EUKA
MVKKLIISLHLIQLGWKKLYVDKAEQIIRNKEVLQFCEEELGQEYSSTKISRHRTQVMVDAKPLDQSDLQSIEEVSWAMISFIEGAYNKKDKASKQHAEQNKHIIILHRVKLSSSRYKRKLLANK